MDYSFSWSAILRNLPVLLRAATVTLQISVAAILVSTVWGAIVAAGSTSRLRPVRFLLQGYVEIFRNTPLLVQLYFLYFGLYSVVGVQFTPYQAVLLALVLNNGAYIGENIRGGLASVPVTQRMAGQSLGLSGFQLFVRILMPQVLKKTLPTLGNQYVALVLSTSLGAAIALEELTFQVSRLTSMTFRTFEFYAAGAVVYMLLVATSVALVKLVEVVFIPPRSLVGRLVAVSQTCATKRRRMRRQ